MMKDAVLNFHKQFEYEPEVVNAEKLEDLGKFVVCGMGGSHLAVDLLKIWDQALDLVVHSDYGLPEITDLGDRLIILSSYSGNTEEIVDAYGQAKKQKLSMAVICTGGKLLEMAQADGLPHIIMPDMGIQPRSALGLGMVGLMQLMGLEDGIKQGGKLSRVLKPEELEKAGKELAGRLQDFVPVIYSSRQNRAIAYNWKIKFNETGKIPAFYNILPELNHNEMTGFDVADSSRQLSEKFYFIFLKDNTDHKKIQKRMKITQSLYDDRGLQTEALELKGDALEKIFKSLIIADWTAVYTAESYGLESEQVPMVEEFKRLVG